MHSFSVPFTNSSSVSSIHHNLLLFMTFLKQYPFSRPRRLRTDGWLRDMLTENRLNPSDLILPLFIKEGHAVEEKIASMPGVYRYSLDMLLDVVKRAKDAGIKAIALFPATEATLKDEYGTEALNPYNLVCRAIQLIRSNISDIGIICDVALDPYTSHGHDGLLRNGTILNDETVEILCRQAVLMAEAGADIVAPSDMMDGRVGSIRKALDCRGFHDIRILSYAAKYASAFYGPFREAVGSAGSLKGDKKTYQMNCANTNEAMHEVAMDIAEGADLIMIKPGMPYLDIIRRVHEAFAVPVFAYQVSGEYAMLKQAGLSGSLNYEAAMMESLIAFKRAGCSGIFTYAAIEMAVLLEQ